jgi:hypothetical protein
MAAEDAPSFTPSDYVEDAELDGILPTLKDVAGFAPGDDEVIPTTPLPPSLTNKDEPAVKLKSTEVRIGPITRARVKLLKQ